MNYKRPLNINPLSIRLPITAIASITHRLSGVVMFLFIPLLLWALHYSLSSPEDFQAIKQYFLLPIPSFLLWIFLVATVFHLFAGIRHLLMDFHWGESLAVARMSAMGVFGITLLCAILFAYRFWM